MGKSSKPYDEKFIESVKQEYLTTAKSLAALASQFGVGKRTIEGWCSDGHWADQRKAQKVVSIDEAKSKAQTPKPKPVNAPAPPPTREPIRARSLKRRGEIDEFQIVEDAIDSLSGLLTGMTAGGEEGKPIDTRGIGGTAGALVKLLEYRRKIAPPTARDMAEQVLALGIDPKEFARELRERWFQRA
jgi:hypothetical protein